MTLASLIGFKDRKVMSREIEQDVNLRQPPVAIALSDLVGRGWVTKTAIDSKSNEYQITSIFDIYLIIAEEQSRKIEEIKQNVTKLKSAMMAPEPVVSEHSSKGETAKPL
jgi:predicted transcriptional regulator